jgi:hypothetical protein
MSLFTDWTRHMFETNATVMKREIAARENDNQDVREKSDVAEIRLRMTLHRETARYSLSPLGRSLGGDHK